MDRKYWKSVEELKFPAKSQMLKQTEFPSDIKEEFDPNKLKGLSRRKFLAISAATVAVATTACKNYRDKGAIVPYNQKPENVLPGKANYYSSTCTGCANHCGILIKTREGRPIKVDGNPDHPGNKGKICATGQAAILNLYDPERYKKSYVRRNNTLQEVGFTAVYSDLIRAVTEASSHGKEISIISKPIFSPSFAKILNEFQQKYPTTKIYTYEFLEPYAKEKAWEELYPNTPMLEVDFSKAKVILSIESNFLATEGSFIKNIREFVANRNVDNAKEFNRFYAIESDFTLTGANADYRIPLNPSQFTTFLASLINEIVSKHSGKLVNTSVPVSKLNAKFSGFNLEDFARQNGIKFSSLQSIVSDLLENQGKSAVVTGDSVPYEVHYLGFLLNEILGNTKCYRIAPKPVLPNNRVVDFVALSEKMKSGQVGLVINLDCNPVFHFSKDIDLANAFSKVSYVFTMAESQNETAEHSTHILPISHNFESWGDFYNGWGLYSLAQPVIEPLYETYQKESIILSLVDGKMIYDNYHKYLQNFWQNEIYPKSNSGVAFEQFWFSVLHDGVFKLEQIEPQPLVCNYQSLDKIAINPQETSWTLIVKKPYFIGDGRFANNPWLLELPHPITKVTWDNYLAISETEAKSLALNSGDFVEVQADGKKLEAPVFIVPGIATKTLAIEAGFGRKVTGAIGENVGFDPIALLSKENFTNGYVLTNVKIQKLNRKYQLASTVEHHSLNDTFVKDLHKSRHIIQEGTVEEYLNGKFKIHRVEEKLSIIPEIKYTGVKWAMAIDLNKCIGCGACISACNVENNVPVVGKDQVMRGREMQWIRVDTYFSGTPDNPEVSLQPMLCQHCDDAPCENVCPVVATNHSPDGLNQMVYNRCVGTRYCSNNCPYKVRRFNFYDFRDHFANGFFYQDSLRLLNNPEVTVRSRGVMEKCTFCIQRITEARQNALAEGRELKGSDVKTACQEACPADAIIFGDMHDKESEVYYWRNHKLGYFVLEELNIKPNVTYIAKLRNKKQEDKA
ncbi:4Fe-4S dicluster domain-containing protein [Bacteroidetes/Chlorobi group bacterium Naka2016]|jgi:molybdopterin-containing oxidoreductase family iron-sulfur binding subunit|nr:MAG: 4Fe-4S dicluster domain-containing protein [Bacteroidetes/Chlorobi group bacterium Naka2016]